MLAIPAYWRMNRKNSEMIGKVGVVVTHTTIRASPDGFESPYVVGLIKLDDGTITTSQIDVSSTDFDKNLVGKKTRCVIRRILSGKDGLLVYGQKFLLEN